MKTSANGKAVIQAFESCLKRLPDGRYTTYRCPANVTTIGWGTTASDVPGLKDGEIWTKARCDDVFSASLGKYEAAVLKAASGADLTQNQFDALVSLCYNCGPGSLNGSIGTALRERRLADIPALMKRWNKAGGKVLKGLVRRRDAEALLFSGDVSGAFRIAAITTAPRDPMPQKIDIPKPGAAEAVKSAAKGLTGIAALFAAAAASWGALPLGWKIAVVAGLAAGAGAVGLWAAKKFKAMKEDWA